MRVLIVDDDMATVDVIRDTVDWEQLGVKDVFIAYNIKTAKDILSGEAVDIVISDIEMPKGSGIDLLEWYREKKLDGEFLFLTCHESFDYATHAMKLHAFEYLLKPFDVQVMEATLKKMIRDIQDKRSIKEDSEIGKWAKHNTQRLYNNFWMDIFTAKIRPEAETIRKEIEGRHLKIDAGAKYRLAVSRILNAEKDRERLDISLILFILENMQMEILLGNPQVHFVSGFEVGSGIIVISMLPVDDKEVDMSKAAILERSKELIAEHGRILSSVMTCCISKVVTMSEFYATYQRALNLLESNVSYYGSAFCEEDISGNKKVTGRLLDQDKLESLLSAHKKMDFMSALKDFINDMTSTGALTGEGLTRTRKEIQQVVYTYLGKKQIAVSGLLEDDNLNRLEKTSTQSVIDMIRWANYLLDATFEYEKSVQKSYTLCDKVNAYIKEHYSEHLGRNEIAEVFFMAPEYLSKMYKKESGVSLNEAIAQYRVEQAKILLERGERVSDVAEKVGFENFTYFSTTFKKLEGVSPTKYKKK